MKKLMFLVVFCALGISAVWAQKTFSGKVLGPDGLGLPGVNVVEKANPTNGTATDIDGNWTLTVPNGNAILEFSSIGMTTVELAAKDAKKITMKDDAQMLDDVIVVAYGTQKKSSFVGAASRIKGESLKKMQSSNLSKSLEGIAPGIQTASSSGQPGSSAKIIIRGLGSISASQEPLIVVDGVPYEGSLNSIPQQDIADVTILKDAAANSMYGARGSNGVIMVTTRKGKVGKAKINVETRFGVNSRGVDAYDIITDPGNYYKLYWRSLYNAYGQDGEAASKNLISNEKIGLIYNIYDGVADDQVVLPDGSLNPAATQYKWREKWTEEPFDQGTRQEYNVNVSGATDKTNYYFSGGFLSDEGYVKASKFKRFTTRVKVNQQLTDFLKVGSNLFYAKTESNSPNTTSSNYSNLFMFTQNIAPIFPIYLYDKNTGDPILGKDGKQLYDFGEKYARPYAQAQNPYATNMANIRSFNKDNISMRAFAEAKFLKDFKFTVNFAYDVFLGDNTQFATPIGGDAKDQRGRGYKWTTRKEALNVNQLLNYNKTFDKHSFRVLLGHETKTDEYRYLFGHMTNFLDKNNPEFNNAGKYEGLNSYKTEYALEGYFSRVEYDFDNKYYFSASLRRDASSRFAPDNRWGTFWAVGGSWVMTKEEFMQDISWINMLKLKGSYGTQGNDNLGWDKNDKAINLSYLDLFDVNRVSGQVALEKRFRGNPDLTWEKSANFNFGFETRLLDRIDLGAEFFVKETKDLIYKKPLSPSAGSPDFVYRNELDMKNTGIEFEVGADVVKTDDILWNVRFNGTHYKNELTRLPSDKDQDGYAAGSYWRKKGGSLYDWYLKEYAGVNEKGEALYNKYVKNDDGSETVETVTKQGAATYRETGKSAIPDFYGGLSTSLNAYGFDFSLQTSFQIGGWMYDSPYAGFMGAGEPGKNLHRDQLNSWTPENKTNIPRLMYGDKDVNGSSDRWLTSMSYFSIRNITLGYTFPKSFLERAGVNNLRVYLVADNVALFSKRQGLDPRQSFKGTAGNIYSALRTVSLGISLGL